MGSNIGRGEFEEPPPDNRERDDKAVALLRVLFHKTFCDAMPVQAVDKERVTPNYFFAWLDREWTTLDQEEIGREASVDADTWFFIRQILDTGSPVDALGGVWYSILLADRPKPPSPVKTINLVCNVTFEDKTISTTQVFVAREMFDGPGFDDPIFFTVMRNLVKQMLDAQVGMGLAGLHREAGKNQFTSQAAEDPFEVLMGWILRFMLRGEPMEGKLNPELLKPVENYMRLAQQCIRPPIPEHMISAYMARKAREQSKVAGKPRGGWNV